VISNVSSRRAAGRSGSALPAGPDSFRLSKTAPGMPVDRDNRIAHAGFQARAMTAS
jgi:hypothetical protein